MNEMELNKRFSKGGELELEEIINHYDEKLLRYATSILCNHQDAEDVVQDVFISVYQNRAAFDGKNLSAWLYKITYNKSLNHLKKRRFFFWGETKNEAETASEDVSLSDTTLQALRHLSHKERALLYGRIMDDQSYEELSRILGNSAAALRKQYERAKKKMARYLNAGCYGKESKYEQV